jgi:hypothetical protein
VSVYYDVTVVGYPNVEFGPIIIAGLRDMYPEILDWISEGSLRTYIVCGCVYLNWCYDGETNDGTFSTCSNPSNTKTATWNFQVANMPMELDWEDFLQHIIGIYEDAIRRSGIDIVEVRIKDVLDAPSLDSWGETVTKDITLDFVFVEEIGADYQSMLTETLTERRMIICNKYKATSIRPRHWTWSGASMTMEHILSVPKNRNKWNGRVYFSCPYGPS